MSKTDRQDFSNNPLDEKNFVNNEELIIKHDVKDTPFIIIEDRTDDVTAYFGVMGNFRITEKEYDFDELKKELTSFSWNRLVQVIGVMLTNADDIKGQIKSKD